MSENETKKLVRLPAFVDLHVHFRDPGYPEKEDLESGAKAAAAGGFTTVCMMPNTKPAIDDVDTLLSVDARRRAASPIHVFAASAMTRGQNGQELCDFDRMDHADTACREMTGHGVCGISEDGMTLVDDILMGDVCAAAVRLGLPVMDHAEPEIEIIRRDIELAKKTGAHFHIQHISLAQSVTLIREAKTDGVPITCETAPHYFALTKEVIETLGGNAKMNPPLANEPDRRAIIEGLADGTIDCIATDHAPHERAVKELPFAEAANGIIGLETSFSVAYTTLIRGGYLTLDALVRLMSTRPAALIGLSVPEDDYVLLDLETPYEIDAGAFKSKSRNTPFHGMEVYGRVIKTVCGGKTVYSE